MHRVFDHSSTGMDASRDSCNFVREVAPSLITPIEFQTLATDSNWEGRALIDAFLHGLSEAVKDELLTRDLPDELDQIITLAIRVDTLLEDRKTPGQASITATLLPSVTHHHSSEPKNRDQLYLCTTSEGEPEVMMVDQPG